MSTSIRLQAPTAMRSKSPPGDRANGWEFVSGSVIERFLDCYWARHPVSRETLAAYRTDLIALDRWMLLFRNKTLVTASKQDIRDFIQAKYRVKVPTLHNLPSLTCIKRFYFHLLDAGFRDDDPTESVFVRTPWLTRRDLTVVPKEFA